MKRAVVLLLLTATVVSVLLSGCSLELRSIESLMRPPLNATERELEKSIQKLLGTHISYRSPQSGEYHSAITIRDINGDKTEDAVVFYVNNDDESAARMCVLTKADGEWNLVSDFAGNGSNVLALSFVDLNSDMHDEILVSWSLFDDRTQKMISVYSAKSDGRSLSVSACISEPYDVMTVADTCGNGNQQLLVAYSSFSKAAGKTTLKLLGVNENGQALLMNETKLDNRITKPVSILFDVSPESQMPRFFIDAQISDSQYITHILEWDSENKKFKSLINDIADPDITLRSASLISKDVDSDGLIEVPLRRPMAESKDGDVSFGYLLEWCAVRKEKLVPVEYFVVNLLENYSLYFPKEWKDKVFVNSVPEARKWRFIDKSGTELFSLNAYNFSDWDESSAYVTEMLMMQNETVYACVITDAGEEYGIKAVDLLKYFALNV